MIIFVFPDPYLPGVDFGGALFGEHSATERLISVANESFTEEDSERRPHKYSNIQFIPPDTCWPPEASGQSRQQEEQTQGASVSTSTVAQKKESKLASYKRAAEALELQQSELKNRCNSVDSLFAKDSCTASSGWNSSFASPWNNSTWNCKVAPLSLLQRDCGPEEAAATGQNRVCSQEEICKIWEDDLPAPVDSSNSSYCPFGTIGSGQQNSLKSLYSSSIYSQSHNQLWSSAQFYSPAAAWVRKTHLAHNNS